MSDFEDEDERRMLASEENTNELHYGENVLKNLKPPGFEDSTGLPATPRENLFFFADYDYFKSPRYEFLSEKDLTKGYLFGLFVRDES